MDNRRSWVHTLCPFRLIKHGLEASLLGVVDEESDGPIVALICFEVEGIERGTEFREGSILLRNNLPAFGLDDARLVGITVMTAADKRAPSFFTGLVIVAGEEAEIEEALFAERRLIAGYSADVGTDFAGEGGAEIGAGLAFLAERRLMAAGVAAQWARTQV